jgi:uncharacterized membrane protein
MTNTLLPSPVRRSLVLPGTALVALYWLVLGVWMAASPHTFFDRVGPFGTANVHYIRDNATFEIALGLALLVAVRRPAWRVPLLALVLAQDVLHVVNHLVDVAKAHPRWVGVFDAVSLAVFGALVAWLLIAAHREQAALR